MTFEKILLMVIVAVWVFMAGTLISLVITLGRIERDFKVVQELQCDVKRLQHLTEILEPARPIGRGQ